DGLGFLDVEPAHGVHLVVAVGEASATVAHEEEPHPLPDAHRPARIVPTCVPVGHVAEWLLDGAEETGLLTNLAHRRVRGALPSLHVALRNAPHQGSHAALPPSGEHHLPLVAPPPDHEPSRPEPAHPPAP